MQTRLASYINMYFSISPSLSPFSAPEHHWGRVEGDASLPYFQYLSPEGHLSHQPGHLLRCPQLLPRQEASAYQSSTHTHTRVHYSARDHRFRQRVQELFLGKVGSRMRVQGGAEPGRTPAVAHWGRGRSGRCVGIISNVLTPDFTRT